MTNNVDSYERARIVALLTAFMIAFSSPFGYISGLLANLDRRLAFVLNVVFFLTALITVSCMKDKGQTAQPAKA